MSQIPKAVLKRLKPLLEPTPKHNPIIRSFRATKASRRIIATSSSSVAPSSSSHLNLRALRSLARHLFARSTVTPATRFSVDPTPALRESVGRLGAGGRVGSSFQPSAAAFRSARVGLGGMGSAPMGPSVRAGMRSVGNVGFGSARAYSSATRPLFDNLANAPIVLRALANSLEDKLENIKTGRPASSTHLKGKATSRSKQTSSLFQPSSILSLPEAASVEPTNAELHALYFSPSTAHTLPTPSSSSSSTVTTLLVPFSIPSPSNILIDGFPLSYLAQSHRAAYELHASRVDGLIDGLTQRGAFLDDLIRLEQVREADGAVLGLRVVFDKRSEAEVEQILQEIGQDAGQGDWFFLLSKQHDIPQSSSVIFPTLSFSSTSTFNPSFPSSPTPQPAVESYHFPTGVTTPASAISPSSSSSSVSSLSDSEISLDASESVFLGFSSSFLSEREDSLVGSVMSF